MVQAKNKRGKGSVGVEVLQGRLRLRLPRQLYNGKQKYLTLGLDDSPGDWKIAQAKAKQIESNIAFERFDHTLNKYRPEEASLSLMCVAVRHDGCEHSFYWFLSGIAICFDWAFRMRWA